MLPAVDVGKSVSRVGGKAQRPTYRAVAGDLKLAYAQFEELETFARFGARLDENTRNIIEHGRRIRACLKQPNFAPVSVPEQIAMLLALTAELFDAVPLERMAEAEQAVREAAREHPAGDQRPIRDHRQAERRRPQGHRGDRPQGVGRLPTRGQTVSDTTASLRTKIGSAGDLQSVVRTMKALAASSIGQYEKSVLALGDYYRTVELGLGACLRASGPVSGTAAADPTRRDRRHRLRLRPGLGRPV